MAAVQGSVITLVLLSLIVSTAASSKNHLKIVTKLIHRDSFYSPYYNSTATKADLARHAIQSSLARANYLAAKVSSPSASTNDYRAGVSPESSGAQFMVNFSIGEPPVYQLAGMDTGSNLLWIQCLPCVHCFEQYCPIFDPSKSKTYHTVPCKDPVCNVGSVKDKCDDHTNCMYSISYLDTSKSKGIVSTEKLTFETSDEGTASVSDVLFGCGHDNDAFSGDAGGILGLGPESISLTTKLGSKFSYCIGSIEDRLYAYNHLVLGDGAQIEGDPTPLEAVNELYYLTMEGISVGEKMLKISPGVFQRSPSQQGGVVIDSGTTLSLLNEGAYGPLIEEIRSLLDGKLERVDEPTHPSNVCYKGTIERDLVGFPVVTFHFAGGAELDLEASSMFHSFGKNVFCTSVHESTIEGGLTVIGAFAQQYNNIGFDIAAKKIYFQRIDCQLLESFKVS